MIEYFALAACVILAALSVFQILLIFGAPLGKFAWGGQHAVLPKNLRIASIFSLFLYGIFAVFVLSTASIVEIIRNETFLNIGMWTLTAYFFLGVLMNAMSRSKYERILMTPVALSLTLLFFAIVMN